MRLPRYLGMLALVILLFACAMPGSDNGAAEGGENAAPAAEETQAPNNNNAQPVAGASWQSDDPEADLTFCATGDQVDRKKIARINTKVYVDVIHAGMDEVMLNNPAVTIDGQMCGYRFTLDYGRAIDAQGIAEGEVQFSAGDLIAHYGFNFNNGTVTWDMLVENTDSHAGLRFDNWDDFDLQVQGSSLVITVPCYAVPRANDTTAWQIITFNRKGDGDRLYCDTISNDAPLPAPQVYWHGTETVTVGDPTDDVVDLSNQSTKMHNPAADILTLTASLASRNAPVTLTISEFPPDEAVYDWSAVVRMNMSLVGPGQLICGRNEDGMEGLIDPKTLVFNPNNGLATFQTDGNHVGCTFAPPAMSVNGCVAVSGDFYVTDIDTEIRYKDRVNGVVLCYQQP